MRFIFYFLNKIWTVVYLILYSKKIKIGKNNKFYFPSFIFGEYSKKNVVMGSNNTIHGHLIIDGRGKIDIGDSVLIGKDSVIRSANKITLRNNILISSGVTIIDHNSHSLDPKNRINDIKSLHNEKPKPFSYTTIKNKPIEIHDNVWIGRNAIIMKGVVIGTNSVVGAHAVVTKSVPKNSIAVGNPAQIKKIK